MDEFDFISFQYSLAPTVWPNGRSTLDTSIDSYVCIDRSNSIPQYVYYFWWYKDLDSYDSCQSKTNTDPTQDCIQVSPN